MKIISNDKNFRIGDQVITHKFKSNKYNSGALLFVPEMEEFIGKRGNITIIHDMFDEILYQVHDFNWPKDALSRI